MVNDRKTYRIAFYAIMFALIFVARWLDIAIGFLLKPAICILLFTFVFCFLENKWLSGVLSGLFFGLATFITFFMGAPQNLNPLISVVPRMAALSGAFGVYRLMLRATVGMQKEYKRQTLCMTVATAAGLLLNTFLYLGSAYLVFGYFRDTYDSLFVMLAAVVFTNILPEYLVSLLAVPHVVLGVRRGLRLGLDGNLPLGSY